MAFALAASLLSLMPTAQAANLLTTMSTTCQSSYGMTANSLRTVIPVSAPSATTLTGFKLLFGGSSNASSMSVKIYSSNPTTGNPSPLGTFTYSSISGNTVSYTGNISIPNAGTYWLYFQTSAYNMPCYNFSPVTTGSATGWTLGGRASESFDSGGTWNQRGDNLSFIFTIEGNAAPVVVLSNYGPATFCYWDTRQNYATLFQAGTSSTITQVRMQFEANALDSTFNGTRVNIYTNNSGTAGSLVGTLYPNSLASATTAAGASVATRVGTYTGAISLTSGTQYWFELRGTGSVLSMCSAGAMVTQTDSWSMVLTNSEYNLRTNGNYSTWGLNLFQFEITRGERETTAPVITGPASSTADTATASIDENTTFSHTYTANEFVLWSISGPDSATFTINDNGALSTTGKNYEVRSDANSDGIFTITIRAEDASGNVKLQGLNLTIDDVNEFPIFSTNGGASTHSVSVAENQINVITFTGTDPDAGTSLSWFFASNAYDQRKFDLNSSTGVLTFKVAPDYESPTDTNGDNVYQVIIGLFDGANLATQTLSVTITNVNESSSIGTPTISTPLYKGISATISVVADTPGKVRFFINGKRIAGCLARATSGAAPTATATCTFKPATSGSFQISARITPTNSGLTAATSPNLSVTVGRRTTTR